jgi:hypothetical protein
MKQNDIIPKMYDLIIWTIRKIEKMPRDQKFILGDRLENTMLETLDLLIEANFTHERAGLLKDANMRIEKTRYLYRMLFDLHYVSMDQFEYFSGKITEIGRMVGGWRKSAA